MSGNEITKEHRACFLTHDHDRDHALSAQRP